MSSRNLILGTVYNCSFHDLGRFFDSFKKTGSTADLVLFTDQMSGVSSDSVICVPFKPRSIMHNLCYRFKLYRDFLKVNAKYEKIILTDVRDVFFQYDPFLYPYPRGLSVFLEDKSKSLATCPFNSAWIHDLWGQKVLDEIGHHPISCAGVTVGDYAGMMLYLKQMSRVLSATTANLDQGCHNGIIRMGWLDTVNIFDNEHGPVLTMGYMDAPRTINVDGSRPAIIHQYDRFQL